LKNEETAIIETKSESKSQDPEAFNVSFRSEAKSGKSEGHSREIVEEDPFEAAKRMKEIEKTRMRNFQKFTHLHQKHHDKIIIKKLKHQLNMYSPHNLPKITT
jgi:hypothetical protein